MLLILERVNNMGIRARKTIKLAKGVNLNLNKGSVGLSVGGKLGRVTVNSKGRTTATVHTPIKGVSYVETHSAKSSADSVDIPVEQVAARPKKEMKTGKGMLITTICLGWLGVHRYASGQVAMGFLYTLTFGLFCIGWFYDIFRQVKALISE